MTPLEARTPKGRERPLHVLFWKFPKVKNYILEDEDSTMPQGTVHSLKMMPKHIFYYL